MNTHLNFAEIGFLKNIGLYILPLGKSQRINIKKSRFKTGFFYENQSLDFIIIPAIHTLKGSHIIKTDAHFFHHFMRRFGCQLTDIKWLFDHKMMNRMSRTKITAEQLERDHPPWIEYLGLFDHITWIDIAIIMHI